MGFVERVMDFNVRGQRDEISHPGFIVEFKFCPDCGEALDRQSLSLLTYSEAFEMIGEITTSCLSVKKSEYL